MNEFKKAAEEIIDLFDKKQVKDLQTSIELVKTLLDILVELFDNSDDEEDKQWAVRYAITKLLPLASKMMQSPKVDDNSISKVFDVYKRTYAFCGRRSLVHFIDYMEWDRSSERKVYVNRKEVLDPIIFYLNKIRFDENMEILGISLPPSFGKSFSVNYFTAWLYGVDLNTSVLRLSYNDDLLNGVSRSIKDLVSSDLYSDIFPHFKLYKNKPFDKEKDSDWKLKNSDVQVSHYVRTRDGGTTGVRANTAIILDDMTKGFEEANNDSVHELYWNKYVTEWINRFDGHKVKYIFVGTMWNPKDILNKIKDKEESISPFIDDDKFKYVKKCEDGHAAFITIPLLDDDDKSTCENVMSTQKALQLRDITDPFSWSCVYQQKPISPTGLEFAYENLNTFKKDDIKEELTSYAFAVLDPTRKGKDNISMPIFNKTLDGETHYMTDVFYKKVAMTDAYDDIIQKIIDDKIIHLFVENNTDTSLKAILDMKLKEKGITYCLIDEKYNTAKKEIRIKDARGLIIKQMRFKAKGEYSPNSDYGRFMSAFTTYSFDYANKNDDAPDSLALYVTQILLNGKQKNTITPLDRSKIGI